ncbi:MAG: hypothetical protein AAF296_10755 [Pseudomonadota bacterium]
MAFAKGLISGLGSRLMARGLVVLVVSGFLLHSDVMPNLGVSITNAQAQTLEPISVPTIRPSPFARGPRGASANGFCTYRFTVTTQGTITNQEKVFCEPSNFDRTIDRHVGRLRYDPQPAVRENVEYTFIVGDEAYQREISATLYSRQASADALVQTRLDELRALTPSLQTVAAWERFAEDFDGGADITPDQARQASALVQEMADAYHASQFNALETAARGWTADFSGARKAAADFKTYSQTTRRPLDKLQFSLSSLAIDLDMTNMFEDLETLRAIQASILNEPKVVSAFRDYMLAMPKSTKPGSAVTEYVRQIVPYEFEIDSPTYQEIIAAAQSQARFGEVTVVQAASRGLGPSSNELARAVFDHYQDWNAAIDARWQRCLDGTAASSGTSAEAILCLEVFAMQTREAPEITLNSIRKDLCKSTDQSAHFDCQFQMDISVDMNSTLTTMFNVRTGLSTMVGRFIKTESGWVYRE